MSGLSEEFTRLAATESAALIRRRAISPVELVEAHLERIERVNPKLNAIVTLAPDALEQAREAEKTLLRGAGEKILLGVPVTIKDTIDVRGMRSTAGTRVREHFIPESDAPAVKLLREAGAIILGKTNASELALDYTTENPVFGRTLNPHDSALTPGGSSGGCAAAVSACLTPLSLGSDLAGSIRIPSHFCGITGLKPTTGRVRGEGHFPPMLYPYDRAASLGPLARNVEDLWLMLRALTGAAGELEDSNAEGKLLKAAEKLSGSRVGWYVDDGRTPVTAETKEAVKRAAFALQDAGLQVEEACPPGVERSTELWLSLFSNATSEFVREVYKGHEAEAGPVASSLLRRANDKGAVRENNLDAWRERERLRIELLSWMEKMPLLVAPVGSVPAFKHEESRRVDVDGVMIGTFRAFAYAQAFNVFDLPAACVPAGRTREGLPIGVQIVGRPFEEERVLAAARIVEKALGGWMPPPEFFPNEGKNPL